MTDYFINYILPILRVSTPLIFAALGGLWCERSGVIQIGLEGYILVGSFFGAVSTLHFGNPYIGLLCGGLAGFLVSLIYATSVLKFRANQIVASTGINLLALGITPFCSKIWYDSTGSTPPIPTESQFQSAPLWIMLATVAVSYALFKYSRFGLRMRFAGEHPGALSSSGISVEKMRWIGVSISGFLAGVGGATLSTYLSSSFIRNMSAGRGFIALAAVILGKWRPIPTVLACLFFGFTEQAQIRLQGVVLWGTEPVPVQWIQVLPYFITIVVLAGAVGRARAPKALGQALAVLALCFTLSACQELEDVKEMLGLKVKTLPVEVKNEMNSANLTPVKPTAGALAKENSELLSEMMKVIFNDDKIEDRNDFGALSHTLTQGASLEGIYRGIVMGSRYRGLESKAQAANPAEVKVFAVELAELQDSMKNPSEFSMEDAKKVPTIEYPDGSQADVAPVAHAGSQEVKKKKDKNELRDEILTEFIGASSLALKRTLGEESLKKLDEMKNDSGELAQWYAKFVLRMCETKVDFGLPQRNQADFDFHFRFAQKMALDRVKWEVLNRYHRLLNAKSTL